MVKHYDILCSELKKKQKNIVATNLLMEKNADLWVFATWNPNSYIDKKEVGVKVQSY